MSQRNTWLSLVAIVVLVTAATQWWGHSRQQALGQQLARAASAGDIQMLSSTTCGICTRARRWFQDNEVRFDECFIDRNAACAARFEALRAPGTPVILVRGQPQLGFDPQRILLALK
jgi:glutaredoxin